MIKECKFCLKKFNTNNNGRKFCSWKCYLKYSSKNPNKTTFQKGSTPWNKNLKGIHFSPETEFKKGQKSINCVPIGTVKFRTSYRHKYFDSRQWIKITEPNKWIEFSRYIWQKKRNKLIPKGMIIHHKDSDPLHNSISNLQLVTRAKHINIHRPLLMAFNPKFFNHYKLNHTLRKKQ